jgi:hypothetical protein
MSISREDFVTSVLVAPCCGCNQEPMVEDSSGLDRAMGCRRFVCLECGFTVLVTDEPQQSPAPKEATEAAPATPEKLRVLMERARRGESLWHPQDSARDNPDRDRQYGRRTEAGGARRLPRGVTYDERKRLYRARLAAGGVRTFLGYFDDARAAGRAVRLARAGDVAGAKALARH